MSKLLINENPILVLPTLAKKIGLNQALFIQQLHYWLADSKHTYDGYQWVYNTYEDWHRQFPFWSTSTIRRIIGKLEREGLIVSGNYNRFKMDKTKWYRINYEYLESLMDEDAQLSDLCNKRTDTSDPTEQHNGTHTDASNSQKGINLGKASSHQTQNNLMSQNKPSIDKRADQTNANVSKRTNQSDTNLSKPTNQNGANLGNPTNQTGTNITNHTDQTVTKLTKHNDQNNSNLTTSGEQAGQYVGASLALARTNITKAIPETTSETTPEKKSVVIVTHARAEEQNPFTFFEQNGFGTISGYLFEKIQAWCEDLSQELVLEAMKIAVESGNKNWSYVEGILRRWFDKGYQTINEVRAAQKEYRERLNKKSAKQKPRMERDIPRNFILDMDAGEDE
ncbi:DnaD domain-containing protein [Caldibacillus thermoamylovorans]|uniref:DnaD domain-containing protein n=1 Tax=Caldibacillus thermoamylovorans TaxID=35841 RepID=UPI00203E0C2B|nr:DnaD domain protein [Caldibacillus thermoamylovorans]MCM3054768.1 DnaD domain protein [Caldibacillus thermoamylovorans]